MMLLNESPAELAKREDPAQAEAYWSGWSAFIGAMSQSGIVINGDGLHPPDLATTLRIRGGKRTVQDGPYADTKEALGGYFVIEVPDLDAALAWAAKAPCVHDGSVELRPVLVMKPPA